MARKRIGELLLERGAITRQQLEQGLSLQRSSGMRLGAVLVDQKLISETQLTTALGEALSLPVVDLSRIEPDWSAMHLLRARFCETHDVFPFALETEAGGRQQLFLAMADPLNVNAIEELEFMLPLKLSVHVATLSGVRTAVRRHYYKVTGEETLGSMTVLVGGTSIEVKDDPAEEDLVVGVELPPEESAAADRAQLADLIGRREQQVRARRKPPEAAAAQTRSLSDDMAYLFGGTPGDAQVERLERKFWALMRIMAKKGLISREEFLEELDED